MQKFKGPRPNSIVIAVCKFIMPFWLKWKEHLSIEIRGAKADLEAFSTRSRAVILLNHSDRQDPYVVFELMNKMREELFCVAAREIFDWDNGWLGLLLQSVGCYSVMRGQADFHSIATTQKMLREGHHNLALFPEAEITGDSEKLHEMQGAIFHMLLNVQEELSISHPNDARNSLVVIPAAIKYTLTDGLEDAVEPALRRIETLMAIKNKESSTVVSRINAVVDAYLCGVFQSYGFEKPKLSLEELSGLAAVKMLGKVASRCDVVCDDNLSPLGQLYDIRNKIGGNTDIHSVALRQLFLCLGIAKPSIQSDIERIERLLVLQRMLEHIDSEIQCCRILDFIESELFKSITPKGFQSCVVSIGAPIEVSSFSDAYAKSKEEGVASLKECFRQKLQNMLLST